MKNAKIIQQVYYSISNNDITSEYINKILVQSRKNNSKKNITGCLLYHKNVFLQLLEGEEKVIKELYKIIEKDERHSNVTEIISENIDERMFPGWNMAFHDFENKNSNLEVFVNSIDFFSDNNENKTDALDLFWRMAKQIVK